jgi:hypothetical protein
MTILDTERGAALIGGVLIIVILSMLATVSLTVAVQEIEGMTAMRDDAVARHLAEAGIDLVVQWFHDPASRPANPIGLLFRPRHIGADGRASFFDAAGRSQFTGTRERPDLLYDATKPADDRLLNDPRMGWFRSLGQLGRITRLVLYGPTRPGLLCTVEVSATSGGLTRTVAVQLAAQSWPAIRSGLQVGLETPVRASALPFPASVHWGTVVVNGDVHLGPIREIPVKSDLAQVTGQAYSEMAVKEDRWFEVFVGGDVVLDSSRGESASIPAHVHPHQEPSPGLPLDRWDYQALKEAARREGTYYVLGQDGLFYRNGQIEPGQGITPTEALRSATVGDQRGLVFVDTLDQTPPRAENLGTVKIETDYMEGVFILNAHLLLAPSGGGKALVAANPLSGEQEPSLPSEPVALSHINLRGVLITPGDLVLESPTRVFGAVLVGGQVIQTGGAKPTLEIWYDRDLSAGLLPGVSLVYPARGTWEERYGRTGS